MNLELVQHVTSFVTSTNSFTPPIGQLATATSEVAKLDSANFISSELLRGVPTRKVLKGFGQVLAKPPVGSQYALSHDEAEASYNMSREVEFLDWFISHSWRDGRWAKYISMLFLLNHRSMMICMNAVPALWFAITFAGMPVPKIKVNLQWGDEHIFLMVGCTSPLAALACIVSLSCAHRCSRTSDGPVLFLDKCCIHQLDAIRKAAGIAKLGGFLQKSRRMVVLCSPRYFDRLWCVYELACYSSLFGWCSIDVVPLSFSRILLMCIGTPCASYTFHIVCGGSSTNFEMWSGMLPGSLALAAFISGFIAGRADRDLCMLRRRISEFTVRDAECYCCSVAHKLPNCGTTIPCDRHYVENHIKKWFDELTVSDERDGTEAFERHVRENLGVNVAAGFWSILAKSYLIVMCFYGWAGLEITLLTPVDDGIIESKWSLLCFCITLLISFVIGGQATILSMRQAVLWYDDQFMLMHRRCLILDLACGFVCSTYIMINYWCYTKLWWHYRQNLVFISFVMVALGIVLPILHYNLGPR